MTRGRRRAGAVLLAGTLLIWLLGLGVFPQEPLRRWSEARLRTALGPQVHIGRLHVVPFLLRAEAWDVRLSTEALAADLPHLRLQATAGLLRGEFGALRALELDAPRVVVRATPPGTPSSSEPWRGPLTIARLRVRDGRFGYEGDTRLELRGLSLDGALGSGLLLGSAQTGVLALPAPAQPLELSDVAARALVGSDLSVQLEALRLTSGASRLAASGRLGRPGAWVPRLEFAGEIGLADVARAADIAGRVRVSGQLADGAVEAALTGDLVTLAGHKLHDVVAHVSRDDASRLHVDIAAALLGGRARGEGTLHHERIDARLRLTGLDARALGAAAPAQGRVQAELHARGRLGAPLAVQATAHVSGAYDGQATSVDARAQGTFELFTRRASLAWNADGRLAGSSEGRLQALELRGTGRADGVLPPALVGRVEGRAQLRGARTDTPLQARFGGDLRLDGTRLSTRLVGQALGGNLTLEADMRGTRVAALHVSGERFELADLVPGLAGRARLAVQAHGPAARLEGSGSAQVEGAAWQGVPLGSIGGRLRLESGLPRFEVLAPALAASAVGMLADGALSGSAELRDSPLGLLGAALGRPLEGRITARAEVDLKLQAPRDARVFAHVAALELTQPTVARALRPFELRQAERRTHVSGLEVEGAGARFSAEGSFGAEDQSLDVQATARLDLARVTLPEGARASGTVAAEVHLGGQATQPRAEGFIETRGVTLAASGAPDLALHDTRQILDGGALVLGDLTLRAAGGALVLDGRLPWAALVAGARRDPARVQDDEQARLVLAWHDIDAATLLRSRSPAASSWLQASLAGRAELQGGLLTPSEVSGLIVLPQTQLVASDVSITLAPATFTLDAGRLSSAAVKLHGRDGALDLRGQVDLTRRTLDVQSEGAIDLRVLSPLLGEAAVTGRGELAALISGPLDAPRVTGTLLAHDASLRLRALRQSLTGIEAWLTFDEQQLELQELSARLGGGGVSGAGSARLDGRRLADVDLRLAGRGVNLQYPTGLRSRLDADLRLRGSSDALRLSGDVRAERGLFDLDAVAEASLFGPATKAQPSPLLRSIALDLNVATVQPLRVRRTSESLADLLATAQLTLRGDLETPSPRGRIDLLPGGVATIVGRSMLLTSGRLTYDGTWDAGLDLHATLDEADVITISGEQGRYDTYDLLDVAGTLDAPRLTLRDQRGEAPPADPEKSLALLATGRADRELATSGGRAAVDQAAVLLTGRLGRTLTRSLSPLGLDEISIEPPLVARDTDPGGRFTFAKRVAPGARVIYSHSLRDPEDRFVKLDLGPLRRLRGSVERRERGLFAYTAGQTLDWGGGSQGDGTRVDARSPDERVRLTEIRLDGDRPLPEGELLRASGLKVGQRVGPFDALDAADKLRARLEDAGHLEAEVGAWLEGAKAHVRVSAGPRYDWRVVGWATPRAFARRLRAALFEDEALERGRAELLRVLIQRGHLRARVTTSVETRPDGRTLVFGVEPGPRLRLESARFLGARALSSDELLRLAGGLSGVLADPAAARQAWLEAYRARFFLAAQVSAPRLEQHDGRLSLEVTVDEGAPARIASLTLEGGTLAADELSRSSGLAPGDVYSDAATLTATRRLAERFVGLGHPEARVLAEARPRGLDFDLVLHLRAGPRIEISALDVQGAERTRAALLRVRSGLQTGRPLDVRALAAAENRLLALGTLSSARITSDAAEPGRLRLDVRERAPLALDYRLRYADETGFSVQTDGELRHLFGLGLVLGGRYRVGRDERDARAFLNLPLGPGPLTISAARLSEDLPRFVGDVDPNLRVQRELRAQQALEAFRPWVLLGGYRFKRVTLLPFQPDPIDVAALSLSLVRETRDNPLDPRAGRFYGLDVELAPAWLASDFTFVKGSAQAFFARSRGDVTWAQGYRLSLARGLGGQRLTSTERFKAGGAYTVRGFASDELGPFFLGQPAGGEALLVLNQELRWRHRSGLGTALFYDAGNVYASAGELRALRLRHALGVGLRYSSPFGLLRVDFGFPLARRATEKSWRWFFTFGQAF